MSNLKLKDNYQINLLYQQFKNQNLPNQERFYYAKLLIEQCISKIIAYPEQESKLCFDLTVINTNDNLLNYLNDIIYKFDIETIELLVQKIRLSKFNQTDDNQLFRRLAMLLFNIINNEISLLKKNINTSIELEIQKEIDSLISKMDSFINYEDQIEKLEYELDDLKSVYSFNNDEKTKYEIEKVTSQITELKSKDLFTNQKKLDDLEFRLSNKNHNLNENVNDAKGEQYTNSSTNSYSELITNDKPSSFDYEKRKYPNLDDIQSTQVFEEFITLYNNHNFNSLEKELKSTRYNYIKEKNLPSYVFREETILSLLFYLPENEIELIKIKGIGKAILSDIGSELLFCINNSLNSDENLRIHKDRVVSQFKEQKKSLQSPVNPKYVNSYSAWTENEETILANYFAEGLTIRMIADKLHRTKGAIKARLIKLGYIKKSNNV